MGEEWEIELEKRKHRAVGLGDGVAGRPEHKAGWELYQGPQLHKELPSEEASEDPGGGQRPDQGRKWRL